MKEILEQALALVRGHREFLENEGIDENIFVWGGEMDASFEKEFILKKVVQLLKKLSSDSHNPNFYFRFLDKVCGDYARTKRHLSYEMLRVKLGTKYNISPEYCRRIVKEYRENRNQD